MEDEDFDTIIDRIERIEQQLTTHRAELAQQAAKAALDLVYLEVGKNVVKASLWIIGAAVFAVFTWLGLTGRLK